MKLLLTLLVSFLLISCSDPYPLDADGHYVEGVHYEVLARPIANEREGSSVTEFFWYGCPHCENFESPLMDWARNKPSHVRLLQVPAIWSEPMKLHAKLFFIVQSMDNAAAIHRALFEEVISLVEERDLTVQRRVLGQFFEGQGLSKKEFELRLASAEVNEQLGRAIDMMRLAQIQGTPTIVVNGRYKVINKSAKSAEQVLDIANYLIAQEDRVQASK